MKKIKRVDGARVLVLHDWERGLLVELVAALVEIITDLLPDADADEFAAIIGDEVSRDEIEGRDPALRRLFPPAYADEAADEEFRRYTESEAARAKVDDAIAVWNCLRQGDRITIADADFRPWLRTVTNVRLVVHERSNPDFDEIQEWLAWLLEALLTS